LAHRIQDEESAITLEIAWSQYFPNFAIPPRRLFCQWAGKYQIDLVLAAMEFATGYNFSGPERCAHFISDSLKNVTFAPADEPASAAR
jgi:hypothetical protein